MSGMRERKEARVSRVTRLLSFLVTPMVSVVGVVRSTQPRMVIFHFATSGGSMASAIHVVVFTSVASLVRFAYFMSNVRKRCFPIVGIARARHTRRPSGFSFQRPWCSFGSFAVVDIKPVGCGTNVKAPKHFILPLNRSLCSTKRPSNLYHVGVAMLAYKLTNYIGGRKVRSPQITGPNGPFLYYLQRCTTVSTEFRSCFIHSTARNTLGFSFNSNRLDDLLTFRRFSNQP